MTGWGMTMACSDGSLWRAARALAGAALMALFALTGAPAGSPAWAVSRDAAVASNYERGLQAFNQDDFAAAVIHLKNALQQNPKNLPARLLLGETLLVTGDLAAAEKELETARRMGADNRLVLVPLGNIYLLQGRYKKILAEITSARRGADIENKILMIRGQAYMATERLDKARRNFQQAARAEPDNPDPLVALAELSLRQGDLPAAEGFLDQALAMPRQSPIGWFTLGKLRRIQKSPKQAIEAFSHALELEPLYIEARRARAELYLDAGDMASAMADLEAIDTVRPRDPHTSYLKALIYERRGDRPAAKAALIDAAEVIKQWPRQVLDNQPDMILLAGLVSAGLDRYEEALARFARYVALQPGDVFGWKLLGAVRLKMGNIAEAIPALQKARNLGADDAFTLGLLGSAYIRNGQFDRGARLLERAVALKPNSLADRLRLALGRLSAGDAALAIEDLEKAAALDPGSADARAILTLALLQKRDYDAAYKSGLVLRKLTPDMAYTVNLLGAILLAKGERAAARERFEAALALDPRYIPAQFNLARLERAAGETARAKQRFKQILAWRADQPDAMLELAAIAEARGDVQNAAKWFERARDARPGYEKSWRRFIAFYQRQGELEKALQLARDFVAADPEASHRLEVLGRLYMDLGRPGDAEKVFRQMAQANTGRDRGLMLLGEAQNALGEPEKAIISFRKAISWNAGNVAAWKKLITLLIDRSDFDEALDMVDALGRQPGAAMLAGRLRGVVESRAGRHHEAITQFRALVRTAPDRENTLGLFRVLVAGGKTRAAAALLEGWLAGHGGDDEARALLAGAYARLKAPKKAIATLEQVLKEHPDSAPVLNNLAWLYHQSGDGRALAVARRAYDLAPQQPAVLDTLGWILVSGGEPARGLAHLREASVRAARNPQLHYHIGAALAALGRPDEARAALKKALDISADFAEAPQARALLSRLDSHKQAASP
jgi:putative PEP-CTERM system TPR-repeat lipoprotein